ncbi:MAG: MFS transporter [Chthonomonadales bacterium]
MEATELTQHRNNWKITTLLFGLTGLVEALSFGHLSAFTPIYLRVLHVPSVKIQFWTGMLSAVGFILGLPLLPFWAVWADRYGRKIIIIRSSVAATLIYALFAMANSVEMLAVARFFGGFVLGNTGVMMAVQADITPKPFLGRAVSMISAGAPVGIAIGPAMGGYIIRQGGIRSLFWLDTVLTFGMVVLLVFFLREEPRHLAAEEKVIESLKAAVRSVTHTPAVMRLFTVTFFMAMGLSMAQPYVPILVEQLYHGAPDKLALIIGYTFSSTGIAMAIATPLWGGIGDRVGHLPTLRLCLVAIGGALVVQAVAQVVLQVAVGRIVLGMCHGGLSALVMVLLANYAPKERRSAILTLSLVPQQLAWFAGPLLASLITLAGVRGAFWIAAVFVVISWFTTYRLIEPNLPGQPEA